MAEKNAPAGANLPDLDKMDGGDSLTQPPLAGSRKTPDTEMATPPNPRSRSNPQFSLGGSLGASLAGSILHEQWTPSISANDLPSDLLAESELLQQPPARDPDARRANAPRNKRPPVDTLELAVRPPAKRARRALFDAAVGSPELNPPRSRSLPSRSRWRERGGQMAAEFYSSLRDLSSRAALGEARSTVDSVSKARLVQGAVQVPPGPPKYPRSVHDKGDACVDASAIGSLLGVGALELLDSDWRPAFVVDLSDPAVRCQTNLRILHVNEILRSSSAILELLGVDGERVAACTEFLRFKSWILDAGDPSRQGSPPTHAYGGVEWTYVTLRDRFRFVTGNKVPTSYEKRPNIPGAPIACPPSVRKADANGLELGGSPAGPAPEVALPLPTTKLSFDWTRIPLTDDIPEHIRVARSVDWASTPLGPMQFWSSNLRIMANLVMASPHPASLYWGPKNVVIYNEAYVEIAGRKHPSLMGKSYENPFSSIWEQLDPVFRAARQSGEAMMKYDDHIFVDRQGYVEEVYFTWSIVPVLDEDGEVVGVYNPAFENTRRRIGERRMLTLRKITEMMSTVTDVEGLWCQLLQGLEPNSYDIPCALIYSVDDDVRRTPSSPPATNSWNPGRVTLEGSIGFPADHPSAIEHLDLRTSREGFAPYMRQALMARESPVILAAEDGSLPSSLLEDLELRGFDAPCRTALVLAIHASPADADSVVAFAVLGINPRRPFDDDFRLFISLLSCQLETSVASLTLLEEEVRRGRTAAMIAAQDKQKLSKQLMQRTQEAVESEYRFARMAEFAPVGMFIADPSGNINYCNEMWWEISRYPRAADSGVDTWMDSVLEDDIAEVRRAWAELTEKKIAVTHEFRFNYRRRQNAAGGQMIDTWVLMSASPEKDAAGNVKSIFGCLTDISSQKWAEYSQKQRREEAVELKRQQENFIDITSHEMRNPLSAILQCADEVLNNIADFRAAGGKEGGRLDLRTMLDCCADAANTISFCANHQKRIVDDILTLSKLDSQLLMVTPVLVQPVAVVETVLKMFQTELASRDILVEFCVEQPYLDYGIDWVRIDPSRLRQVVINLMTNAIKFTQNREQRVIVVSVSASKQVGCGDGSADGNVQGGGGTVTYFPRATEDPDITKDEEWGEGEEINLHFSVQDTGPGLTPDEIKVLFQRFSQASPRTHVQYGGSGLGLFVSRMLTELQGGQIGVMSQKGVGSTFTFYIKSRRAEGPAAAAATEAAQHGRGLRASSAPLADGGAGAVQVDEDDVRPAPREDSLAGMEILIVEDNVVNQKVLQRQLQNHGCRTSVANHGGEAIERLKTSRFWRGGTAGGGGGGEGVGGEGGEGREGRGDDISVILMDLEMPVMDGMTSTKRIRELQRDGMLGEHIPIIAVTAYARPQQIESAKAAGADDVISKPFRLLELIPKIRELAARYGTGSTSRG